MAGVGQRATDGLRAAALCLAWLAALVAVAGWPAVPPVGAIDKLVYLGVAAIPLAVVAAGASGRRAAALDTALAVVPTAWLAWPLLVSGQGVHWLSAGAVAVSGWLLLTGLRRKPASASGPPALFVAAAALAVIAFYGASIRLAEIGAALAAALIAVGAVGFLSRRNLGGNGALVFAAALLLFFLAQVLAFYTISAPISLLLLLAAILLAGRFAPRAGGAGPGANARAGRELSEAGSAALLAAVPALAAVALAVAVSPGAPVY